MKILKCMAVFALCLAVMTACGTTSPYEAQSFFAMDTMIEIRLYSETEGAEAIFASVKETVDQIERAISVTAEGGDTYRLNADGQLSSASPHLCALISISEEISRVTDGAFDIRTGALIELWKLCESEGRLPTEEERAIATSLAKGAVSVNGEAVNLSSADMKLNFGAVGKGYAADIVAEQLQEQGVTCGMVSFVSSVTVFGQREAGDFRIAVRCPDTSGDYAGFVTLRDASLSVSGNYERFYEIGGEKYDHILDPKTGYPAANAIDSVVVVADSGALADALSTAITVMGAEAALSLYKSGQMPFEAAIFVGNEILMTDGFSDVFEAEDGRYRTVLLSDRY